jgi:dTDP-4-dehydrorhamnose 3,5-epimerase
MFEIKESQLKGCYVLQPKAFDDARGRFVKVFHESAFEELGLETVFVEDYYSVSYQNVIRGLHFQLPPMDHTKMVYCVEGEVLDAVVDLRVGSPTYGQFELFELTAANANIIYIPKGMAHGFCVKSQQAKLVYKVSTVYSPECDSGIRWSSVGIPWLTDNPIVSIRDENFPNLNELLSPFRYEKI